MDNQQRLSEQFAQKVLYGVRLAVQKLVEKRAAENATLVIAVNGKPCEVPARDLLPKKN